ncbi:unnamed protein product, partial [Nesidiocoris tenuis]
MPRTTRHFSTVGSSKSDMAGEDRFFLIFGFKELSQHLAADRLQKLFFEEHAHFRGEAKNRMLGNPYLASNLKSADPLYGEAQIRMATVLQQDVSEARLEGRVFSIFQTNAVPRIKTFFSLQKSFLNRFFAMLQQILNEMWVDPEILAELDESQKQTLFCKMREEQVRRWKVWDNSNPPKPPHSLKASKKRVEFLMDIRGEPWTWVMGEHSDDKSIEEIMEQEAREAARRLAEKEAQSLRKTMEAELTELLELNKKQREEIEVAEQKLDAEDIYCSADELKSWARPRPTIAPNSFKRDALQEISFNK